MPGDDDSDLLAPSNKTAPIASALVIEPLRSQYIFQQTPAARIRFAQQHAELMGLSPLMWMVVNKSNQAAKALLDKTNVSNEKSAAASEVAPETDLLGFTVLQHAILCHNHDMLLPSLLTEQQLMFQASSQSYNALQIAALTANFVFFNKLSRQNRELLANLIKRVDQGEVSLIHYAVKQPNLFRMLLSYWTHYDRTSTGQNILHQLLSITTDRHDDLTMLPFIEHIGTTFPDLLYQFDYFGSTPMMHKVLSSVLFSTCVYLVKRNIISEVSSQVARFNIESQLWKDLNLMAIVRLSLQSTLLPEIKKLVISNLLATIVALYPRRPLTECTMIVYSNVAQMFHHRGLKLPQIVPLTLPPVLGLDSSSARSAAPLFSLNSSAHRAHHSLSVSITEYEAAAYNGNLAFFKTAAQNPPVFNTYIRRVHPDYGTLFHLAVKHPDVIIFLLSQCRDEELVFHASHVSIIFATDKYNNNFIAQAVLGDNDALIERLADHGKYFSTLKHLISTILNAQPFYLNKDPLKNMLVRGKIHIAKKLIKFYADNQTYFMLGCDKNKTIFMEAASRHVSEFFSYMREHHHAIYRKHINDCDSFGNNLLHLALSYLAVYKKNLSQNKKHVVLEIARYAPHLLSQINSNHETPLNLMERSEDKKLLSLCLRGTSQMPAVKVYIPRSATEGVSISTSLASSRSSNLSSSSSLFSSSSSSDSNSLFLSSSRVQNPRSSSLSNAVRTFTPSSSQIPSAVPASTFSSTFTQAPRLNEGKMLLRPSNPSSVSMFPIFYISSTVPFPANLGLAPAPLTASTKTTSPSDVKISHYASRHGPHRQSLNGFTSSQFFHAPPAGYYAPISLPQTPSKSTDLK